MGIIDKIRRHIQHYKSFYSWIHVNFLTSAELGLCDKRSRIELPIRVECPKNLFIHEYSLLRRNAQIINGPQQKVVIKKYCVIAANCTIVTDNHVPTVGIPTIALCKSHIHDRKGDVIIEEDVWVGANVTILAGVTVGRGAVIAGGAVVTKNVPPYSVVAGVPARVIGKKFDFDDILKHESILYPKTERIPINTLTDLYEIQLRQFKTSGNNTPLNPEERQILNHVLNERGIHLNCD